MTVSDIVKDLLKYKMITKEAASVLLTAEVESIAYRNQTFKRLEDTPYHPPFKVGDADWTWDPNRHPILYRTDTINLKSEEL